MVLETADQIIDHLGGTKATAGLVGISAQAVSNWRAKALLPADTFVILSAELAKRGHRAPASLWSMREAADA